MLKHSFKLIPRILTKDCGHLWKKPEHIQNAWCGMFCKDFCMKDADTKIEFCKRNCKEICYYSGVGSLKDLN